MNIKFKKNRSPFKKGDIISSDDRGYRNLAKSDPDSIEFVKDEPNLDGAKLSARQKKEKDAKVEKLIAKAEELEAARK